MRIGILTSGGDAPGMNAAIEAVARRGEELGVEVIGVRMGFEGLRSGQAERLDTSRLFGVSGEPGTLLGSSRPKDMGRPETLLAMAEGARRLGLEALIILGGHGSLGFCAPRLEALGLPCVGVPCTIDNDVPGTDPSIGFDTACTAALAACDSIRATAHSLPGRVFMVETLGGETGYIALAVAEAAEAEAVAVPEEPVDPAFLAARLRRAAQAIGCGLLVASEGVRWRGTALERDLGAILGDRVRLTVLGHAQRGAPPGYRDRLIARRSAIAALEAATAKKGGIMIGWAVDGIIEVPLDVVQRGPRPLDRDLHRRINGLA